jgi:hypothetical protein
MTDPGWDDEEEINSIVTPARLNRFMSSPRWTPEQWEEAAEILEGLEGLLAGCLNTYIKPVPYSETVTILGSGQVNTSHPVAGVTKINGTTVADPLPIGWTIREHRLYSLTPPSPLMGQPFTLSSCGGSLGEVGRVAGVGSCSVEYLAGWGNVPALRVALLKKARIVFRNQHDDSVRVNDLDAEDVPEPGEEEWTDAELKNLERFRNIVVWR